MILSKIIGINADTIKFYKNNPAFNRKILRHTKAWTTNIILKLADEIYAMFYIDCGCEILVQTRAITAKFLSACRFLRAQKARPYRH